jgi:hypothetical protein
MYTSRYHHHIDIYIYIKPGGGAVASPIKRQLNNNSSFIYFFCLARRPPSKPPGLSAEVEKKSNDAELWCVCVFFVIYFFRNNKMKRVLFFCGISYGTYRTGNNK